MYKLIVMFIVYSCPWGVSIVYPRVKSIELAIPTQLWTFQPNVVALGYDKIGQTDIGFRYHKI